LAEEPDNHSELNEIVVEAQSELQKNAPNKTKLRTLITGIGKTIEYLPKLQPAFQMLQKAVVGIGGLFL